MSNERYTGGAERTEEIEKAAAERSAELREQESHRAEHEVNQEKEVLEARAAAEKEAKSAEEHRPRSQETAVDGGSSASRSASYKQTMKSIQHDMSGPSRVFSKVIHNKTVDKVSDVLASTVARPNAILSGAVCAFVLVLGVYVLAKYMGFALYGSETIAAFIAGWLIGLLFDLLKTMFKRKS